MPFRIPAATPLAWDFPVGYRSCEVLGAGAAGMRLRRFGLSGTGARLVTIQAERTGQFTGRHRSDRQKGSNLDPVHLLQPGLRSELLLCAPGRGELRAADGNHRSEQFL